MRNKLPTAGEFQESRTVPNFPIKHFYYFQDSTHYSFSFLLLGKQLYKVSIVIFHINWYTLGH